MMCLRMVFVSSGRSIWFFMLRVWIICLICLLVFVGCSLLK